MSDLNDIEKRTPDEIRNDILRSINNNLITMNSTLRELANSRRLNNNG